MFKLKHFVVLLFLSVAVGLEMSFAAEPINISLFPPIAIHQNPNIAGLDFGLIGVKSANVTGVQWSWILNQADSLHGAQFGFINVAKKVKGLQWGFLNMTDNLTGVQIGLVNIARSGAFLPVMVFINAGF